MSGVAKVLIPKHGTQFLQFADLDRVSFHTGSLEHRGHKLNLTFIHAYTKEEMMHYGSGTVIHNRFVITRRNVVEIVLLDNGNDYSIFISNERTENELFCKVIYDDEAKDLALLHCPRLSASDISSLQLSHEAQKVGFHVFCFGYPNNYHETEALCVNGMISHIPQERQGSMVLCSTGLNHCLSGGPVLLRDDCGIIMIGIVKERCISVIKRR